MRSQIVFQTPGQPLPSLNSDPIKILNILNTPALQADIWIAMAILSAGDEYLIRSKKIMASMTIPNRFYGPAVRLWRSAKNSLMSKKVLMRILNFIWRRLICAGACGMPATECAIVPAALSITWAAVHCRWDLHGRYTIIIVIT